MYNFTEENIKMVERFIDIKNRGLYCSSQQLQNVYNQVFGVNMATTTCGSCLRKRVCDLEKALASWRKEQEKETQAKKETEITVEGKEDSKDGTERKSPTTTKKRKRTKSKTT